MARKLSVVTTLEEFQERWRKVDSEAEAIGLLYALGEMKLTQDERDPWWTEEASHFFVRKATLLLDVLNEVANNRVTDTARKVVGSEGFLIEACMRPIGGDERIRMHFRVLDFFGSLHECLLRPPYPDRIQRYLVRAWHSWRDAVSGIVREEGAFAGKGWPIEYKYAAPLVRALALWGEAEFVAFRTVPTHSLSEKKLKYISEREVANIVLPFLENIADEIFGARKEGALRGFVVNLHGKKIRTPNDLRSQEDRIHRNGGIARALVWARLAAEHGDTDW